MELAVKNRTENDDKLLLRVEKIEGKMLRGAVEVERDF